MSWCPTCKKEYPAGLTICPDCKEELAEELTENFSNFISVYQTDDVELKDRLVKYLLHCGQQIKEEISEEETEDGMQTFYSVLVPAEEEKEARKEIRTVLAYDQKQENGEEESRMSNAKAPEPSTLYVEAKERYHEYKSSGIMFLAFAAIFLVFGILNCSGMVNIMTSTASLVIIFVCTAVFLYVGISSLMKVSSLKEDAFAEEASTNIILAYLKEEFPKETVEKINKSKITGEEITGERLYFLQMETMKEALVHAFPDKEENYLDSLLEDYYNTLEL